MSREEVLPIYNIELTVQNGEKYRHFRLQPDGEKLKTHKNKDGSVTVTVPRLDIHTMVVGELK